SKPFDPHALNQILEKWLQHKHVEAIIKGDAPIERWSDFERGVNQLASVDSKRGLQLSGHNVELYRKLLQRFAESQGTSVLKLRDTRESDFASTDFKRLLHTLKGLSGTIGAEQLASDIAQLESILDNSNRLEDVSSIALLRLGHIANLLDSTIKELLAFLNTLHKIEPNPDQTLTKNTAQIIDSLVSLLGAADSEAIDFFQTHLNEFSSILFDKDFLAISNAIENYEFDLAISLLRTQKKESNSKAKQS
ncbi:Hpt domain-containing protein, partial [Undibacterium sp.]|uniref:Hpt domain-containing protein n=1 Tax=Undibacterium sp. TaxID=1914977 RepID=UPI00375130D9